MNIDSIDDTLKLRKFLLQSMCELRDKQLTVSEARARAWLARAIIDTVRMEVIAARTGVSNYAPVDLIGSAKPTTLTQ